MKTRSKIPGGCSLSALFTLIFFSMSVLQVGSNQSLPKSTSPNTVSERSVPDWSSNSLSVPRAHVPKAYDSTRVSFEVNQGQTNSGVKFLSRGRGYNFFLTQTGAVMVLNKSLRVYERSPGSIHECPELRPTAQGEHESRSVAVMQMMLNGANAQAKIEGVEQLPTKSHYFIGNDASEWRTDIAHYSRVKYQEIYPGVDLVYHGNHGQLEYDFIVAPHADYRAIVLNYTGVTKVRIDRRSGDLVLTSKDGDELRQQKPTIFQEVAGQRLYVDGGYELKTKDQVAFRIAEYDPNIPLTIDPVFVYSTYLGGGADDIAFSVAADSSGNTYVTGRTYSTNFPTVNPFRSFNSGLRDLFITKFNPAGTILYSTYVGGAGDDLGFGIAVNSSGEPYVTGWTNSNDFPLTNALQPLYGGGTTDSFLVRLNSTGNSLITSTYVGGSGEDVGYGIALDSSRNIYGTGYTTSTDLTTVNAIQPFNAGGVDAFLLELSPSGDSLVFATYAGGSGNDFGNAIAVDGAGYIYAIGDTNSTNLTTVGALQDFNAGGFDAFLGKLAPSGSGIIFSTYAGGSGDDLGRGIAVDGSGNIYAAGFTNSTDLQLIVNAIQPTKDAGYDAFVAKLNSTGSSIFYSTFLGGNGDDGCFGLAVDSAGNAYLTGETLSTNFYTVNALMAANAGAQDAFLTKLNPGGSSILFSTYLGGAGRDTAQAIAVDESGNAYVAGITFSTNFPTANPVGPILAGPSDAFVAKISTSAPSGQAATIFVEQGSPQRAVALDSVTKVRGPFRILTDHNFSTDYHTRVILFTSDLGLTQPDPSQLTVTAGGVPLTVENVGPVQGVPGLSASYIVVRLPVSLPTGDLSLVVTLRGLASVNSPLLGVVQ